MATYKFLLIEKTISFSGTEFYQINIRQCINLNIIGYFIIQDDDLILPILIITIFSKGVDICIFYIVFYLLDKYQIKVH